jgi:hypothetical protein
MSNHAHLVIVRNIIATFVNLHAARHGARGPKIASTRRERFGPSHESAHGDARGRAARVVVTRCTVIFLSSKKNILSFIFRSSFVDAAREGERATDASLSPPSRRSVWVPIAAAVAAPAVEDINRDKKT